MVRVTLQGEGRRSVPGEGLEVPYGLPMSGEKR